MPSPAAPAAAFLSSSGAATPGRPVRFVCGLERAFIGHLADARGRGVWYPVSMKTTGSHKGSNEMTKRESLKRHLVELNAWTGSEIDESVDGMTDNEVSELNATYERTHADRVIAGARTGRTPADSRIEMAKREMNRAYDELATATDRTAAVAAYNDSVYKLDQAHRRKTNEANYS